MTIDDYRLKTNVQIYLINTMFLTVRKDIGFFTKEQWQETAMRINQLIDLVSTPIFGSQLRKALDKPDIVKEQEGQEKEQTLDEFMADEVNNEEGKASAAMLDTERSVFPSLPGYAERLEQELYRAFQRTQQGNIAYLVRLQDENQLLFLLDRMLAFLKDFD